MNPFCRLLLAVLAMAWLPFLQAAKSPNFVVIFCDDMGYGDLGCYGHPTIHTPHLDRMATEGVKFTQFYSAACVCTPSRAGLLTGRLPVRSGMCSDKRRVLFPNSAGGLPPNEITLSEGLKTKGYATTAIGKWHLGHLPQHLPTNNGFDSYFGIPYSNDMDRLASAPKYRESLFKPKVEYFNVPLLRDTKIVERPADQTTITRRYTEEAVRYIKTNKAKPFFVYLAHSLPHVPLFTSTSFSGVSRRGLYGDVIEEIDWSVGQVLKTLQDEGLAENTLVFFTSDNGPWLIFDTHGGSAGLLRDGKGSTWEGGMREPGIAWWPGRIKPHTSGAIASTMDIFTTCLTLAGAKVPNDRVVDGVDLSPVLFKGQQQIRESYFYYRGEQLYAVRKGPWKAHYITRPAYGRGPAEKHDPPELYHLGHDPSEKHNLAKDHPEVLTEIAKAVSKHNAKLKRGKNQLDLIIKK
jgi:arylsulfatase A-like enzyme